MQQLLLSCVLWCLYCQNIHRTHRWLPLYLFKLSQHDKKYLAWLWQNLNGLFDNKTAQILQGLNKLNELCNLGRILFTRLFVSGKDWWRKQTCGRGFGWCLKEFPKDDLAPSMSCSNSWFFIAVSIQLIVAHKYTPGALMNSSPLSPLTLPLCRDCTSQSLARRLVHNHKSSPPGPTNWLWFDWWSAGWDELLPPALKAAKCFFLSPSLTRLTTSNN